MSDNRHFDQIVAAGNPIGEIISVDRFLIRVRGLHPVNTHALVMFQDGTKGYVQYIYEDHVTVFHLGPNPPSVGMTVVVQYPQLVSKVGKDFLGRVVNVTGDPLDGKGPVAADGVWPVFAKAPSLSKRELLDSQLETGVTVIDSLFPILKGQRMTLVGDSRTGKTTLATQIALNQQKSDIVVVYALIAKRRSDIDRVVGELEATGALKKSIVVVSSVFESLASIFLTPYVACSMGEYMWQKADKDVVVIYDDLTNHAQTYRELSLLSGVNPGRDSYPGDMFHAHSSLLERAGKLKSNHKTQSAISLVLATAGDVASYLPTNVMSINDGQWILDSEIFKTVMRPAISLSMSVTRVGGRGQNDKQKQLAVQATKAIADYHKAQEYAHYGSELALAVQRQMALGGRLYNILNQKSTESFTLLAQILMFDIVLNPPAGIILDINLLKSQANEHGHLIKKAEDYDRVKRTLASKSEVQLKGGQTA